MKSKDAASVVVEGSPEEVAILLSTLRADPASARRVLAALSNDSRAEVRAWVSSAARKLLGREAVSYLVKLAQDRDPDVSNVALQDLLDVEPESARSLMKPIRKQLLSNDPQESEFAMWTLLRLDDRDSIDVIRRLTERSAFPFQRRTAEVVLLALGGKIDEILGRIREHDHDYMRALAYAALLAGGQEGVETVKYCAENAPDPECRHYCDWNLNEQRN